MTREERDRLAEELSVGRWELSDKRPGHYRKWKAFPLCVTETRIWKDGKEEHGPLLVSTGWYKVSIWLGNCAERIDGEVRVSGYKGGETIILKRRET